jgi:hypothetical protein
MVSSRDIGRVGGLAIAFPEHFQGNHFMKPRILSLSFSLLFDLFSGVDRIDVIGDIISMKEVTEQFTFLTGQNAVFVEETLENFVQVKLPGIEILAEMYKWFGRTDFTQRRVWLQTLMHTLPTLSNRPNIPKVLTFKDWLMENYHTFFDPLKLRSIAK